MINVPIFLSLLRGFAVIFFISDSVFWRTFAIFFAALTDFLDGYLARKFNQITPLGTLIDPLMDKLFVASVLAVFWHENRLEIWQIVVFLSRDISLMLFSVYLWITNKHRTWKIRSFWSGKIMTTFQFLALLILALGSNIPMAIWVVLACCGIASLIELVWLSSYKK
ncbi:MAG: CDP-alcohol phosphatidyltransferase family protein [Chlamydiales bacterium]|nr:CDP-alcohol phosphatidyltransferase family protein [Chlamydiales bacterium]